MRDEAVAKLDDLRKRADDKANFKALLEEHKALQQESRKNRYTKADDAVVRKAFDSAYQYINEQRNHFFSDKTSSRIKGLTEVIQKMEQSLNRDKKDLEYLDKKTNSSNIKSLELQLLKVKGNMLKEAIASKEEKLKDIYATMEKLQKQNSRSNKQEASDKPAAETTEVKETPAVETSTEGTNTTEETSSSSGE